MPKRPEWVTLWKKMESLGGKQEVRVPLPLPLPLPLAPALALPLPLALTLPPALTRTGTLT